MERGPTCQAVFNRRDRGIRLAQAGDNASAEVERGSDAGTPVNFNDMPCTCMTQADGVEVDVFPAQWRHGVNGIGEAPRPRANGGQSAIGQQGGDGETDAGAHHDTVGCAVGLREETRHEERPLGAWNDGLCADPSRFKTLTPYFVMAYRNAVMFGERLDIVVHDGQGVPRVHRRPNGIVAKPPSSPTSADLRPG